MQRQTEAVEKVAEAIWKANAGKQKQGTKQCASDSKSCLLK